MKLDVPGFVLSVPPAWVTMWAIAIALYAASKWMVWSDAIRAGATAGGRRSFQFLALWVGMDARTFLDAKQKPETPRRGEWISAAANILLGALLLWGVARLAGPGLAAGWIGMTGIIFLLHFGAFKLLANFWRLHGVTAQPLMRAPVAAKSVSEFWGRRWNSAFRELSFTLIYRKLRKTCSAGLATMATFAMSGLIHEAVISIPARGGYGLPTAYFLIQGTGILAEHSRVGAQCMGRGTLRTRFFTWLVVAGPACILFPPPFVMHVILPFLHTIKAL